MPQMGTPGIFAVEIESCEPINLDEFWRDVEATNRCDDPKKACQFLSSLIVRRAHKEAVDSRLTQAEAQMFVETRARELWHQCRSMGFPTVQILGFAMTVRLDMDSF